MPIINDPEKASLISNNKALRARLEVAFIMLERLANILEKNGIPSNYIRDFVNKGRPEADKEVA